MMNKSESIKELATALAKAQGQMSAAKKDESNPFFKSKYADLASVVDAIKKPLADNGLSYSQMTDVQDDGVYVETILMHSSGEWIMGRLKMPVTKPNDPQALGSAMTYCRRFSLQSACGVPSSDDDGNAATGKPGVHRPTDGAEERITEQQRVKVKGIVDEMRDLLGAGETLSAVAVYEKEKLEADETVFLWTFFDSKDRAAMKRAKESLKAA
jgi:hypothetical protein